MINVPYDSPAMHDYLAEGWKVSSVQGLWCTLINDDSPKKTRQVGQSWFQRPVVVFPLAHGIPNRVGKLRGYGNAIVPQVAQAFIAA